MGPEIRWGLRTLPCASVCLCMHPYAFVCSHMRPSGIRMRQYASIRLPCVSEGQHSKYISAEKVKKSNNSRIHKIPLAVCSVGPNPNHYTVQYGQHARYGTVCSVCADRAVCTACTVSSVQDVQYVVYSMHRM